jgi:hypothetical protein
MTHYTLPVNSKNHLTLTHTFKGDIIVERQGLPGESSITEVITFGYRRLPLRERDGSCTVKISKDHGRGLATVGVDLHTSGGSVPFKKATVSLSWSVDGVHAKRFDLNLCGETRKQGNTNLNSVWEYGRDRVDVSLQIDADLDEDEEDKVDDFGGNEENSLASDFGARLNDDYLSDIKVVAGKSSFHCHKFVLASRSDVFKAMFSHDNVKECVDKEIILEEDPAIVQQFLEFVYSDEVLEFVYSDEVKRGLEENSAAKLLLMGDKYNVQRLKKTCHRFLVKECCMDTKNCCKFLVIANLTNCDILEKKCCAFIIENVAEVMKTEGWAEISRDHPKLFQVILEKNATALSR